MDLSLYTQICTAGQHLDAIYQQLVGCEPRQWNDSAALAFERQRADALALTSQLRTQTWTLAAEVGP